MEFLNNKFFLIAATFLFYLGAQLLQRRTGIKLLNPILLAIAAMICFLLMFDIDYATYQAGGEYIDFWLKPAVVALGLEVPHAHIHLIPIQSENDVDFHREKLKLTPEEFEETARMIRE